MATAMTEEKERKEPAHTFGIHRRRPPRNETPTRAEGSGAAEEKEPVRRNAAEENQSSGKEKEPASCEENRAGENGPAQKRQLCVRRGR